MVVDVQPGAAAKAGVLPGDVIVQIAGQQTDSPRRFDEVVRRLTPGQSAPLLVQRRGAPLFLALEVPATDAPPKNNAGTSTP
jgi:serine protease Do